MKDFNTYIIEKLQINKDIKIHNIDPEKCKILTDFFERFFNEHQEVRIKFKEIKAKLSEQLLLMVYPKKHGITISEIWPKLKPEFKRYVNENYKEIKDIVDGELYISPVQKYHISITIYLKK